MSIAWHTRNSESALWQARIMAEVICNGLFGSLISHIGHRIDDALQVMLQAMQRYKDTKKVTWQIEIVLD